jgi:hypothetical protein
MHLDKLLFVKLQENIDKIEHNKNLVKTRKRPVAMADTFRRMLGNGGKMAAIADRGRPRYEQGAWLAGLLAQDWF